MSRKTVRNLRAQEAQKPDCCTCIHRRECERYRENSYCTKWQSREPNPEGPDPNELWKRGEEVGF